ncbi:MAG: SEC-C domain-containing protein [Catenulisporales bacterium]|nr:SEC-C domain-containing protein [Catenulisporales bacterium]
MGKKSSRTAKAGPAKVLDGDIPVVGAREACPCGSGRRYKACHGREAAAAAQQQAAATTASKRPFEGLPGETDIVAMRELVPAATAPLKLVGEHADRKITLATVLPMAAPAVHRDTGEIMLALQTLATSGDPDRDLADALLRALDSTPGTVVDSAAPSPDGPRLRDLLDTSAEGLDITVHDDFGFWIIDGADVSAEAQLSLEHANAAAYPTKKLESVPSAYWTRIREKGHLRWVMPHEEEKLMDALARLHAAKQSGLGEGTRYVGAFRPVWDLPKEMEAAEIEKPAAEFAERLAEALADESPLSNEERRARAGLVSRQVTLR